MHRSWRYVTPVVPFEAATLRDIGFDGDMLRSTGYDTNAGCNEATCIVGATEPDRINKLKEYWTDERRAQARRVSTLRQQQYERSDTLRDYAPIAERVDGHVRFASIAEFAKWLAEASLLAVPGASKSTVEALWAWFNHAHAGLSGVTPNQRAIADLELALRMVNVQIVCFT